MTQFKLQKELRFISRPTLIAGAALLLEWLLCGCVLVGGYKSGTGFLHLARKPSRRSGRLFAYVRPSETLT